MIPHDTIDKLALCFASLTELGSQLTETQWKLPTDCPGWSVQDNLSHIVAYENAESGGARTLHQAPKFDYVRNPIGEANENEIDIRRSLTGAQVLDEWKEVAERRLNFLRTADESYFTKEVMTPTGPGTTADFLHIRVLDCWVHEQDMRRAVGMPGHLSGPAAEHTIDRLIRTVPIVVGKRAATPDGQSVVIDITGGVQRHIVCTIVGGRAALVIDEPEAPLSKITVDSATFLALATGRQTDQQLASKIAYSGDVDHGRKVTRALNMMI